MDTTWTIVLEPEAEGFCATIPEYPGAVSWGINREEATRNVLSAVDDLRASYRADGLRRLPEGAELTIV